MSASDSQSQGYVRIAETELPALRIQHLTTAIDMSIALPQELTAAQNDVLSGYTEWAGTWRSAAVSVGWDWGFYRKQVLLLNPAEVRTNIQLIAGDGLPRSPQLNRLHVAQWLDTLPWRDEVYAVLPGNGDESR
jgi:hypothetical protein